MAKKKEANLEKQSYPIEDEHGQSILLEVYRVNQSPELFDGQGKRIGTIGKDGKIIFTKEYMEKLEKATNSRLLGLQEKLENGSIGVEDTENVQTTPKKKKQTKQKQSISEKQEDLTEQLEQDLGLKQGEILSSTKLLNQEEFIQVVPTAKQYSNILLAYTKDGSIAFYGENAHGQYEVVEGTKVAQSISKMQTVVKEDQTVEREGITGLIDLQGENEKDYAFTINMDIQGQMKVRLLRKDREDPYKVGLAKEIETQSQRPSSQEVDALMDKKKNQSIQDELNREEMAYQNKGKVKVEEIKEKTVYDKAMIKQQIKQDTMEQLEKHHIRAGEIHSYVRGAVIGRLGAQYEEIEGFVSEICSQVENELEEQEQEFHRNRKMH